MFALKIIGYIGVSISLIALSLTVLILVCLRYVSTLVAVLYTGIKF